MRVNRMQTSYIYSASRVQTLADNLLGPADVERLLAATTQAEQIYALKESYLAPYLLSDDIDSIMMALEAQLQEVRQVVMQIAPHPQALAVLWLKYDFHNLRVFMRGKIQSRSYADTVGLFSPQSHYPADDFYEHALANTLYRLEPELHEAYHTAYRFLESGDVARADQVVDAAYFACLQRVAVASQDPFIRRHVAARVDLFNLRGRLRTLAYDHFDFDRVFVPGGTIAKDALKTAEQATSAFALLGGEPFWRAALEEQQEAGHSTRIDVRADDYLLQQAVEASHDMFSVASLVAYVMRARYAAATVRSILVGTSSGVPTATIRHNLHAVYGPSR